LPILYTKKPVSQK